MPISDARKRANRKWDEANRDRYDKFKLTLYAGDRERIQAAASRAGVSMSEYIRRAIDARITADAEKTADNSP